jgi:putative hydroxymethylpyrimidine transport system substrate-binding protein
MACRAPLLAVLAAAALAWTGCAGSAGSDRPNTEATLLLDFQPNGVHAGIYLSVDRGFDEAEGVELEVQRPGASTDALKLLRAGRAQAAILDIHDLGLAVERGAEVVGVMAIVQRTLAAVIAAPDVADPRDLEGGRAGVTGLPSDDAVLRAVLQDAGADPARVDTVTIGFQAVKALLAGRVDAVTAFWNVEGVALQAQRPGVREFRVDDFGAPRYPELVLVVNRTLIQDEPGVVRAIIRALQRGYTETQRDPESAVQAMVEREPDLDRDALTAQLDVVAPAFQAGVPAYGLLDPDRLRAWARWDQQFGILEDRSDVRQAFDTTLVGPVTRG